jgi:hypothetical protein
MTDPKHYAMTGPEHYTAAEKLIESAYIEDRATATLSIALAQAHATLALAAATALGGGQDGLQDTDFQEWNNAAGRGRPQQQRQSGEHPLPRWDPNTTWPPSS